ncbi:MAG: electron transport complex subunit RsxD [Gammaproteobacteria bacterium]|nr:electron transport complex subunit RsxD [Gammaproteobacteria bacterium]
MIKRPAYPPRDTAIVMRLVLLALIPGIVTMTVFFGPGVLFNLATAVLTAVAAEALCISLRGRELTPRLGDLSAVLTGVLIALSLPQAAPWWLAVAASGSSIILGKHLYGGLGQNPVNPAMLGYALMLISAPVAMTTLWINPLTSPSIDAAWIAYVGQPNDGLTGATVLDLYRTEFLSLTAIEASDHPLFTDSHLGFIYGYEWAALAYLIGGLWLIYQRVITWHTPVGLLVTLIVISAFFSIDPDTATPVSVHLIAGAGVFAAFFILTDPVSGATSPRGRLWFAIGVGVLTYLIRTYGQYPDAIAFSVLLMNFAVPVIDNYTRPRIRGHDSNIKGSGARQ